MPPENKSLSFWFESEVKTNEAALRAYIQKKVPAEVDVDDVVQEAYLRIIKAKKTKPISSPRGLLFSIARNIVADIFRKNYAAPSVSLGETERRSDLDANESAEVVMTHADDIEMLQQAIRSLPKKCRKIFILRNYERMSYKDIAAELNISVKTVEAQMTIGMKKCRLFFESKGAISKD